MASSTDKKERDGKSFDAAADTDVIGGVPTIPPIELNQDIVNLLSSDPNDWTLSDFLSSNSEVNPGDGHLSEDYGAASAENTNNNHADTGGGRTVAAGQVTSILFQNI